MNAGIDREFKESEIIHAVIQVITPGNSTQIYLVGRRNLTLTKVMRTMRSHFGEGDGSIIFNQMSKATQTPDQTPYQFIITMFSMRDRVLELAREGKRRTMLCRREFVQQEMQSGIYAGLRDAEIRRT